MLNVNGVSVTILNASPRKVASGWLHSTAVYMGPIEGGFRPSNKFLGCVETITSARHGGEERERWIIVGTLANGGRTIMNGNLSDLVAAAATE